MFHIYEYLIYQQIWLMSLFLIWSSQYVDSSITNTSLPIIGCKYHIYDPSLFKMFTNCKIPNPINHYKHNLEIFFLNSILELTYNVSAEEADLYVVPVLFSQSKRGYCGNHKENIKDLQFVLNEQPYFITQHRNHLIVADRIDGWRLGPQFIVGAFESQSHGMSLGYSTIRASKNTTINILPLEKRRYIASFIGQSDQRHAYRYRELLRKAVKKSRHGIPSDTFVYVSEVAVAGSKRPIMVIPSDITNTTHREKVKSRTKPLLRVDGEELMRNSVMTLSLPGDTLTTDRIFNAFETLTLVGALSSTRKNLVKILPFGDRINWSKIIVWISTSAYSKDPIKAIRESILHLSLPSRKEKYELMKRWQKEILWLREDSRAVHNVIESACKRIYV